MKQKSSIFWIASQILKLISINILTSPRSLKTTILDLKVFSLHKIPKADFKTTIHNYKGPSTTLVHPYSLTQITLTSEVRLILKQKVIKPRTRSPSKKFRYQRFKYRDSEISNQFLSHLSHWKIKRMITFLILLNVNK